MLVRSVCCRAFAAKLFFFIVIGLSANQQVLAIFTQSQSNFQASRYDSKQDVRLGGQMDSQADSQLNSQSDIQWVPVPLQQQAMGLPNQEQFHPSQRIDQQAVSARVAVINIAQVTAQEKQLAEQLRQQWRHLMNTQLSDFEILGIASTDSESRLRYANMYVQARSDLLRQTHLFAQAVGQVDEKLAVPFRSVSVRSVAKP